MKKFFVLVVFAVSLLSFNAFLQAQNTETVTISTYYPSPFGVYQTLRLFPNDNFTPGAACTDRGQMYYDNSEDRLYLCSGSPSGTWQQIAGFWTQTGTSLYPTDTTWNVGIGTTSPGYKLDVTGGNVRLNGWVRIGDGVIPGNNIQFETQAGFHRIAFNELRFWEWDNPGDMVTLNNGILYTSRFVVQKRAANPANPQEGEIWLIQ